MLPEEPALVGFLAGIRDGVATFDSISFRDHGDYDPGEFLEWLARCADHAECALTGRPLFVFGGDMDAEEAPAEAVLIQ
jgi:hypothetical protein